MYILITNNLTKTYKDKKVVSCVNIKIKKGEIYGFLGPNGAGKTTVMKMITNLVKPTHGEIILFGERLNCKSYEVLKRMGSIIETPVFYDKLTGKENLKLHCEYMGYYDEKAIDQAIELVNLKNSDQKIVKEYSLGMKQRLGIARAILTKPELLVLDEPINGLDPVGIIEIRHLLKMLSTEYGITILISSHILGEIEQIADTIGVIRDGILLEEVTMNDIRMNQKEYIEITTSDNKKAAYILDHELNIKNIKILDKNDILRIYESKIPQSQISKTLILNNVEIESIITKRNSLEEYFMNLINGGERSV